MRLRWVGADEEAGRSAGALQDGANFPSHMEVTIRLYRAKWWPPGAYFSLACHRESLLESFLLFFLVTNSTLVVQAVSANEEKSVKRGDAF